jgi:hypothetical protein
MKVLIPGNDDFRIPDRWVEVTDKNMQHGGYITFHPLVFICDEYASTMKRKDGSAEERAMAGEVELAVKVIAAQGRAALVHLIIASQTITVDLFPSELKNNMRFRTACGNLTAEASRRLLDNEDAVSIPDHPHGMCLSQAGDSSIMYHAFYTVESDIFAASKCHNGAKPKVSKNVKNDASAKPLCKQMLNDGSISDDHGNMPMGAVNHVVPKIHMQQRDAQSHGVKIHINKNHNVNHEDQDDQPFKIVK